MAESGPNTVTSLLKDWRAGKKSALDELMPLVHDELRRIAGRYMSGERRGHTLQATALVNEAYARLVDADVEWRDRAHFFAVAARAMRRVLVDHARSRQREKRGGRDQPLTLDEALLVTPANHAAMLDLDAALAKLERHDARKSQVVELHFFGGLSYDEIADVLDIAPSTVGLDMRFAKAWLANELRGS